MSRPHKACQVIALLALLAAGPSYAQSLMTVGGPVYSAQMTDDAASLIQIGTVIAGKSCNDAQDIRGLGGERYNLIPKANVTLFPGVSATAVYGKCAPLTGAASLTWTPPTQNTDGSTLTDLAGYKVYWGTAQGSYPNSASVMAASTSSYVVQPLTPATYYFVVTAVNVKGVESAFSNVATKTIQ